MINKKIIEKTNAWPFVEAKKILRERKKQECDTYLARRWKTYAQRGDSSWIKEGGETASTGY